MTVVLAGHRSSYEQIKILLGVDHYPLLTAALVV